MGIGVPLAKSALYERPEPKLRFVILSLRRPEMKTFRQFLAELKLTELKQENTVVPKVLELLEHQR